LLKGGETAVELAQISVGLGHEREQVESAHLGIDAVGMIELFVHHR
jgi:hypothetical protein